MKEPLIEFKSAKLAKEKGFNWPTDNYYMGSGNAFSLSHSEDHNNPEITKEKYSRPTQSLLQKWIREVHNIEIFTKWFNRDNESGYFTMVFYKLDGTLFHTTDKLKSFEMSLEIGLMEALNCIK